MIKRIKNWLVNRFLPMWAKETVLADNKRLVREIEDLQRELNKKTAYIAGLESGIRAQRRIIINTGEVGK